MAQPEVVTDTYALYQGDCCDVLTSIPSGSIHASVYSPPFVGLYHYSSSERDLSNCRSREEFFKHYEFVVREIERVMMKGRISAVHCAPIPAGTSRLFDLPGEIIRLHERLGFDYIAKHSIWKEPFRVRMRTMAHGLAHRQVVDDATLCDAAAADELVIFRKRGENKIPVVHPVGLTSYAGARVPPADLLPFRGWSGHQTENRYSHWVWRQYASAFWDDIRIDRVLPFQNSREPDDEKHVHPLQLDVIERIVVLRTNPGEIVMTPFMGVGSEVYGAVINARRGIGIELKSSYFKQAVLNMQSIGLHESEQKDILASEVGADTEDPWETIRAGDFKAPQTWNK